MGGFDWCQRIAVAIHLIDAGSAGIGGGGKEDRAVGGDGIDGLGDDAVLEHRLGEEQHVVGDDVSTAGAQREDVLGEGRLVGERGGEEQGGAGCEIVRDLAHAGALVAAAGGTGVEDDHRRRQVAGLLRRRRGHRAGAALAEERAAVAVADRVGQQADAHAGAVDAELGAHRIEVEHRAHLGLDRADRRLRAVERMDRGQPRQRGEIGERGERDGGHQARVAQRYMLDPCAEGDGARHDVGRERREAQLRLGVAAAEPQAGNVGDSDGDMAAARASRSARDPLQARFGCRARAGGGGVAEQHRGGQSPP